MTELDSVTPLLPYQRCGVGEFSHLLNDTAVPTVLRGYGPRRPSDDEFDHLDRIAGECQIDAEFPRPRPTFQCSYLDGTAAVLNTLIQENVSQDVAEYLAQKRIIHRCGMVASVLLGEQKTLPLSMSRLKAKYHELMTLEMVLQTVLDDLVDEACVEQGDVDSLLSFFENAIGGRCVAPPATTISTTVEVMCTALVTLQRQRNHLLRELGIPVGPTSVTATLYTRFLATYRNVRRDFSTFSEYLKHRSDNCGMPIQAYWATHWRCRRYGLEPLAYETYLRETCASLGWYACLGGVSNDLVGYDKDVAEGVATSVSVKVREDGGELGDAFLSVMAFHNNRLANLVEELKALTAVDHNYVLLSSILLSVWSIHVLHVEYSERYDMVTLRAALRVMPH